MASKSKRSNVPHEQAAVPVEALSPKTASGRSPRVLDSSSLPPLPTGEVTEPKLDGMRLCVGVDLQVMQSLNMKNALEVPLVPGGKENTWENASLGVFAKWAAGSLRIQLHGRFFAHAGSDDEALSRIRDIASAAELHFGRRPHLTQVVANRDFPTMAPLDALPLPSASVHWNFLGTRVTPVNQYGGIWVRTNEWALRIYDKAQELRDTRSLPLHQSLIERLERLGVDLSMPMARVEAELRGKVTCAEMTHLLYRHELTARSVFAAWVRKRSIREAPPTANLDVTNATKGKHWPVCERYRAVMLATGPRRTPTSLPKMRLEDRPVNVESRARALAAACVQTGGCLEDAVRLLRQEWEGARQRRAEELADRVASEAYMGRSASPEPVDGRRVAEAGQRKPAGAEADGELCSHPGIGTTVRSDLSPQSGGVASGAAPSMDDLQALKARVRANPTSSATRAELAEAWHTVLKAWEQAREHKLDGERLARAAPVRATTLKI